MQKINHDLLFGLINCKLRLCIMTILRGKPNDLLVVMGILCSTWTIVNAGTSGRDVLCPMGRVEYEQRFVCESYGGQATVCKNCS